MNAFGVFKHTEMFDLFSDMLADEIENGSDLEIDVNVRPPAPTRRKRRSGEASVDVNVKLHNKLPSKTGDDVNVAQTTAIEKSKDIADLISNNIVDEINNYEGSFIDKAAANDVVVSKPSVTFTATSAATTTTTTTTTKATTTTRACDEPDREFYPKIANHKKQAQNLVQVDALDLSL